MQNFQLKTKMVLKCLLAMFCLIGVCSCGRTSGQQCNSREFYPVYINSANTSIWVPIDWMDIDSSLYKTRTSVASKIIRSKDSGSVVWILVNDYSVYHDIELSLDDLVKKMKGKMSSFHNGGLSLVNERNYTKNGVEVNQLEYELNGSRRLYAGHILFLLPNNIEVEVFVEISGQDGIRAKSDLDCILSSIKIG